MAVGCGQSTEELGGKASPQLGMADNAFFEKITVSNMTEINSSRMALTQSQNSAVKQFAQQMIDNHTTAGEKVSSLAASKQVMLPQKLDNKHQMMVDSLSGKSGADFDKAYVDLQVTAHKETIDVDQDEAEDGNDSQTKALASELLGTLKMHLKMAESLKSIGSTGM